MAFNLESAAESDPSAQLPLRYDTGTPALVQLGRIIVTFGNFAAKPVADFDFPDQQDNPDNKRWAPCHPAAIVAQLI